MVSLDAVGVRDLRAPKKLGATGSGGSACGPGQRRIVASQLVSGIGRFDRVRPFELVRHPARHQERDFRVMWPGCGRCLLAGEDEGRNIGSGLGVDIGLHHELPILRATGRGERLRGTSCPFVR